MLHGEHLKENNQMCGHAYSNINYYVHLVKLRANAAIDYINQGFSIVYAHVIFVLKALNLGARNTLCHRYVCYIHQVVHL